MKSDGTGWQAAWPATVRMTSSALRRGASKMDAPPRLLVPATRIMSLMSHLTETAFSSTRGVEAPRPMNIDLRQPPRPQTPQAKARLEIVDVDIHPKNTLEDFRPYLSNRWWDYLQTYGRRSRHGF